MSMLEVALNCVERGWHVFPCWPKTKKPMTERGFKDASIDVSQVRSWWTKVPDANVAIATGPSKLCVVDVDHGVKDLPDVWAWLDAHGMPLTYAVRTGRRPEFGVQLYYSGESLKSTGFQRDGVKGDIRCATGYVMAAGSIHPDSGEAYSMANYGGVNPVPEYVKTLTAKTQDPGQVNTVDDATADDWKAWLLEYMDRNVIEPRDYEKRVSNGWWLGIHCPWEHEHSSGPGAESSTVLGILDGKLAFECSHGTCKAAKRNTPCFKEYQRGLNGVDEIEPGADIPVVLGSGSTPAVDMVREPEQRRPVYPMESWRGTIVQDFAELCGADNKVPLKLYAESFRCVLGAVVGDQIACPNVDGVTPRTYTVLVVPFGKGKGTAIGRATTFFEAAPQSVILGGDIAAYRPPDAFLVEKPFSWTWADKGVGAWVAGASSAPGMSALASVNRPKRKGEEPGPPLWGGGLARVISIYEEAKNLFSSLSIEGGVGHALTGAICSLWDSNRFYGTATGTRAAASGRMLYSMLCGVTPDDWFDLLGKGDIVGGGLFSRLNICGTEGSHENVSRMHPPNFDALRRVFLPRVHALKDAVVYIPAGDAACDVVEAWTRTLPEGSQRMNIHVWRTALLLSWLRGESEIGEETAQDAVKLGVYQMETHDYYRTEVTDNAVAAIQQRIERTLRAKGPLSRSMLYKLTNGKRDGTVNWDRALEGLVRGQLAGKTEGKFFWAKGEE